MPDPIRVPAYRLHKASGRARTRHKGRDVYFPGKFQSRESLEAYARFAAGLTDPDSPALPDVGPKWRPRFVRLADRLPSTGTNKVVTRTLVGQKFRRDRVGDDELWVRERGDAAYRPFTAEDEADLRARFAANGRDRFWDL